MAESSYQATLNGQRDMANQFPHEMDQVEVSSTSSPKEEEDTPAAQPDPPHPRQHIPGWKWQGTVAAIYITTFISGYDVSNVANIQPRLYEAFGSIELLPWIGLSFSLAILAMSSLSRKVIYCFDMRWTFIAAAFIFIVGAIVAGTATGMTSIIVGRIIMGLSAVIIIQINMSYIAAYVTPAETPGFIAKMSSLWAIGIVVGGPISSAMAENEHLTWRWAMYLNIPFVGIVLLVALLCIPSHSFAPKIPLWKRLLKVDPLGVVLNMVSPVLLAISLTFSGSVWAWGSAASITAWVLTGVSFAVWALQQVLCIFTSPEERAFPVHMLRRLDLMPIWIASGCAYTTYGVTMYYTPLYFAFAKGYDTMDQTIRTLPFVLTFIFTLLFTGGILPVVGRYKVIYMLAGGVTLAAAVAMATMLNKDTPESLVMGLEALLGFGLGLHFQHGIGISNVILKDPLERVDSSIVTAMCQNGFISVNLALAGCIFQNVGYDHLGDVFGTENYSEDELREALAGVSSEAWGSRDPAVVVQGVEAVTNVIASEFYIVAATGALCLLCSMAMKWTKLDYGRRTSSKSKPIDPA